jgi:sporulation-control protein
MSKFTNWLTHLGVGGAKLHVSLPKSSFQQGETIKGKLVITGGSETQEIQEIIFSLLVYLGPSDPIPITWCEMRIKQNINIRPAEIQTIPFEFSLPHDTSISDPITFQLVLRVRCIITSAPDLYKSQMIDVEPSPTLQLMMQVLKEMGFSLFVITDSKITYENKQSWCQKFWYRVPEPYRKEWNEFTFIHLGDGSFLLNWRTRGFMGAMRYIIFVDRFKL